MPGYDTPYLPPIDGDYLEYVRPVRLGLIEPLINGRDSGGTGDDVDWTEPLDAMQDVVQSLGTGDSMYLAAWFFEPGTALTAGGYGGAGTWGELFAAKASEGVTIRILLNDFDPISGMDRWLADRTLEPLDGVISALHSEFQDNLKYVLSMHPAHAGTLKSLFAGQGGRDISVASHHQKFMVARRGEEMFAFCGGLDIESRKTPARWLYGQLTGWHDIHVRLQGPITRDLEAEFVMRWNREKDATRRTHPGWSGLEALATTPLTDVDDAPEKKLHQVQMLRTVSQDATFSPYSTERSDVKQAYERGLSFARSFVYLENQYFRSPELAEWLVRQAEENPELVVIVVVVASAAADDGVNAITEHGNHLQYATLERIVTGVGPDRARVYTMRNRAVHSKLAMVDDAWMCVGSANANVRSFDLDSELNVQTTEWDLVSGFRCRLWAHNLGFDPGTIASWSPSEFLARWDGVAAANSASTDEDMLGEGVLAFDFTAVPGEKHLSIPDALADLDLAPEGHLFAGEIPQGEDSIRIA